MKTMNVLFSIRTLTFLYCVVFCLLSGSAHKTSAQALPAPLVNFDYRIIDSEPAIQQEITLFTTKTDIPISVVFVYRNNPDGYAELQNTWKISSATKGILILINSFAEGEFQKHMDILYKSDVKLDQDDVDDIITYSMVPLMQGITFYDFERDQYSEQVFGISERGNERVVQAVIQCIRRLQKVIKTQKLVTLPASLKNQDGSFTLITPGGQKIILPAEANNLSFYQKVTNDDDSRVVAGTLSAFSVGRKRYLGQLAGSEFSGYATKEGEKYIPAIQPNLADANVIMGLVCFRGFYYYQFRAPLTNSRYSQASKAVPYYNGSSVPVLDELAFPIIPYSDEFQLVKEVASNHEALTKNQLVVVEKQTFEYFHCGGPFILPLLKIAQLRSLYPVQFENFWKPFGMYLTSLRSTASGTPYAVESPRQKLTKERLLSIADRDLYGAYCAIVQEFLIYVKERTAPPDLQHNTNFTFITPAGTLVDVPAGASRIKFFTRIRTVADTAIMIGTLMGFTWEGRTYEASISGQNFAGYKSGRDVYKPKASTSDFVVMGIPYLNPDKSFLGVSYDSEDKSNPDRFKLLKIHHHGLPSYTGSLAKIIGERRFPIRPYATDSPVEPESVEIPFGELASNDLIEFEPGFSKKEKKVIKKYSGKPEYFPALKAAQLEVLDVELFEQFTRTFDEWRIPVTCFPAALWEIDYMCSSQSLKDQWQNDKYLFYARFITGYLKQLHRHDNSIPKFLTRLQQQGLSMNLTELTVNLRRFQTFHFEKLTVDQRILILRLLTKADMMGGEQEVGAIAKKLNGAEGYSLAIVRNTPDDQKKAMLARLTADKDGNNAQSLLHALSRDYYGLDGEEFTKFVTSLTEWVSATNTTTHPLSIADALNNKKAIPFKPGFWFGSPLTDYFDAEGKVHLKTRIESNFQQDEAYDENGTAYTVRKMLDYNLVARPFEYIMVNLKEDYEIGSNNYKKGQILMMPAFHAYLLFTSENAKRIDRAANIALSTVIFVVGFPEFSAFGAASLLTRAIAYYEVGLDVSDFVVSYILIDKLEKSAEGKKFLQYWQAFQMINTVGMNVREVKDQLVTSYQELISSNNMSLMTSGEQKMLEDMVKYAGVGQISNWPHPEYSNLGTRLNSLSPELKASFTQNIKLDDYQLFEDNLLMVDAWLVMQGKDPEPLKALAEFLKRNPDVNYNFLKNEFDLVPAANKANWLSDLNSLEKYRELELKLKTFSPAERINFRHIFSGNEQFLKDANNNLLLADAWKVLSVDVTLRSSVRDITNLSQYLKIHPARGNLLPEEFQLLTSTTARQDWITSLVTIKDYPHVENRIFSQGFSPSQRIAFRKEYKNAKHLLAQMSENEFLVDAWKVIGEDVHLRSKGATTEDIFLELKKIADYLEVNTGGLGNQGDKVAGLIEELKTLTGRNEKFSWLSGLKTFADYPSLEYFISRLPKELRADFRIDFRVKGALLEKFRKSPEMIEAWRVLHADPLMRCDEKHLETVFAYIQKRTRSAADLEQEFAGLQQGKRLEWVNTLKNAPGADLPVVDGLSSLTQLKTKHHSVPNIPEPGDGKDWDLPVWPFGSSAYTARSFFYETGNNLYDITLTGGFYVKIDASNGRVLLGSTSCEYYAFGVIQDNLIKEFRARVFASPPISQSEFDRLFATFLNAEAEKLKAISGVTTRSIALLGRTEVMHPDAVSVILGRFKPDIEALFRELGDYKNVGLGERNGGIVLLNKPDGNYVKETWWDGHNKPFLKRAVDHQHPIYLATIHASKSDVIDAAGNLKGAYAQELQYLSERNYKPVNISDAQWLEIRGWFGFSNKISKALEAKLSELTPALREAFKADFGDYVSDFNDDPLQVDAWRVLFADPMFRKGLESRKAVRSFLENNARDVSKLEEEFAALTSANQRGNWVNGVKSMAGVKHRAIAYKITRFDPRTRIECRIDFQNASAQTLDGLADDVSLLDVWKNDIKSTDLEVLRQYRSGGNLRAQYIAEVNAIKGDAEAMLAQGKTQLEAAQFAFETRRATTIRYKHLTPDDLLDYILKFNTIRYKNTGLGDEWGMTWEGITKKYGTNYAKIIDGASRPLGDKKDVGKALFETFKNDAAARQKLEPILIKYRML